VSEQSDIEPGSGKDHPTSRRELLKKAAIVGGVAWSMPVIESFTTPAYAGSLPPCRPNGSDCTDPNQCCSVNCDPSTHLCIPQPPCGHIGSLCGPGRDPCCPGLRCVISVIGGTIGVCVP
jgi:hypothetical protein